MKNIRYKLNIFNNTHEETLNIDCIVSHPIDNALLFCLLLYHKYKFYQEAIVNKV